MKGTTNRQRVTAQQVQNAESLRKRMTYAEKVLWAELRANRLGGFHFRRQHLLGGFIADFYCCAHRLVVVLSVN